MFGIDKELLCLKDMVMVQETPTNVLCVGHYAVGLDAWCRGTSYNEIKLTVISFLKLVAA
jgi:hypothetical protein